MTRMLRSKLLLSNKASLACTSGKQKEHDEAVWQLFFLCLLIKEEAV